MSATSKPTLTVDHYGRLSPLGVMIIHYASFRPVLTCPKQTFAELEQTARQFFVFPKNAQLRFFTTFVTNDMLRIDPEVWPRIYQMVNALWIEIDISPPQKSPTTLADVGGTVVSSVTNQCSAPSPGPTPPPSTATPSADATSSDKKQTPASSSGSTTPKSTATRAGAKSSGANQTSASGPGPASLQPTATPKADAAPSGPNQTSVSGSGATTAKSIATPSAAATTSAPKSAVGPVTSVFGFGTSSSSPTSAFTPASAAATSTFSGFTVPLPSTTINFDSPFTFGLSSYDAGSPLPPTRFAKPVIYLYPPTPTSVNVRLSLTSPWEFSAIYPLATVKHLESGPLVGRESITWDVFASPDGQLHLSDGLEVSYLYWEAETRGPKGIDTPPSLRPLTPESVLPIDGFDPSNPILTPENSVLLRVAGDVTKYLDKALLALGLHTEARTSFITYWLPSFVKHEYIALRFVEQSSYEAAACLDITPKPDVVTRVFMVFRGIDGRNVADWSAAAERAKGMDVVRWRTVVGVDVEKMGFEELFRVLEWGGMEVYR